MTDSAPCEFAPHCQKDMNDKLKTFNHTYYISIGANMKGTHKHKQREILKEPKRSLKMGLGYDLDIENKLKYTNISTKYPKRKKILNWIER